MRALIASLVAVTATLCVHTVGHLRASDQQGDALSADDTNDLIRRRCVLCHSTANARGGLNLQLFDAHQPDAAVALMISVKVGKDGAMFAAGDPPPSRATVDEFVRVMARYAAQNGPLSGSWTIDLQADPAAVSRGHSVVLARKQSDAGEVRMTCNGAVRKFESTHAQPPITFEGLSPALRSVFTWCLGDAPAPR
jgi:hypothetical protein